MNKMELPPDVEFHEDVRLIVWRPRGLLNRTAVNRIITVLGELETRLKEPFDRFTDTVAADAVDLNFDSRYRCYSYSLRPAACLADSRFTDQSPRVS